MLTAPTSLGIIEGFNCAAAEGFTLVYSISSVEMSHIATASQRTAEGFTSTTAKIAHSDSLKLSTEGLAEGFTSTTENITLSSRLKVPIQLSDCRKASPSLCNAKMEHRDGLKVHGRRLCG